jgi:hypothetical protein
MSYQLQYQVALIKGGKFDAYKTAWLFADTNAEAIKKAKECLFHLILFLRTLGFRLP